LVKTTPIRVNSMFLCANCDASPSKGKESV
jgi:hypothetical protein